MTTQQAAQLARRAWLEQQEHRRWEFVRWLVRRRRLSDWPGEVDRLFLSPHWPRPEKKP